MFTLFCITRHGDLRPKLVETSRDTLYIYFYYKQYNTFAKSLCIFLNIQVTFKNLVKSFFLN